MSKPRWLTNPEGLNERELKIWRRVAFDLHKSRSLEPEKRELLAILVRLLALQEAATEAIQSNGVTSKSNSGSVRANPAANILISAQREALPLLRQFGLCDPIYR